MSVEAIVVCLVCGLANFFLEEFMRNKNNCLPHIRPSTEYSNSGPFENKSVISTHTMTTLVKNNADIFCTPFMVFNHFKIPVVNLCPTSF